MMHHRVREVAEEDTEGEGEEHREEMEAMEMIEEEETVMVEIEEGQEDSIRVLQWAVLLKVTVSLLEREEWEFHLPK